MPPPMYVRCTQDFHPSHICSRYIIKWAFMKRMQNIWWQNICSFTHLTWLLYDVIIEFNGQWIYRKHFLFDFGSSSKWVRHFWLNSSHSHLDYDTSRSKAEPNMARSTPSFCLHWPEKLLPYVAVVYLSRAFLSFNAISPTGGSLTE